MTTDNSTNPLHTIQRIIADGRPAPVAWTVSVERPKEWIAYRRQVGYRVTCCRRDVKAGGFRFPAYVAMAFPSDAMK